MLFFLLALLFFLNLKEVFKFETTARAGKYTVLSVRFEPGILVLQIYHVLFHV